MQHRATTNTVLTISGLYSLVGWLGPPILKFFNFVQLADGLREMMNLIALNHVSISWPGIYLFGFIASAVGIVSINLDLTRKYISRKRVSHYRDWNMNGCDAILYIANNSLSGTTFPENSKGHLARSAFYEAARIGKIQVAGMSDGSTLLKNIPNRIWDGENRLDFRGCMLSASERSLCIRWKDEEKILYWGLMVDEEEIRNTWPEAPIQNGRV